MERYAAGSTELRGPVDAWQRAEGHWTEAFGEELERARVEQRAAACPVCGLANTSVSMESIYGMRPDTNNLFMEFAGRIGQLITLEDCGHIIKR